MSPMEVLFNRNITILVNSERIEQEIVNVVPRGENANDQTGDTTTQAAQSQDPVPELTTRVEALDISTTAHLNGPNVDGKLHTDHNDRSLMRPVAPSRPFYSGTTYRLEGINVWYVLLIEFDYGVHAHPTIGPWQEFSKLTMNAC